MALQMTFFVLWVTGSCWGCEWKGSPFDICVYLGRVGGQAGEGLCGLVDGKRLFLKVMATSVSPFPPPSVLLLQPHLHSYKEAFEEMEGTSPTSPPPSGGKSFPLSPVFPGPP